MQSVQKNCLLRSFQLDLPRKASVTFFLLHSQNDVIFAAGNKNYSGSSQLSAVRSEKSPRALRAPTFIWKTIKRFQIEEARQLFLFFCFFKGRKRFYAERDNTIEREISWGRLCGMSNEIRRVEWIRNNFIFWGPFCYIEFLWLLLFLEYLTTTTTTTILEIYINIRKIFIFTRQRERASPRAQSRKS